MPNPNDGAKIAAAARELIGTPYRLHGRLPETGLDCVGLVACALKRAGVRAILPRGYGLRTSDPQAWIDRCRLDEIEMVEPPARCGDVILVRPGPGHVHLMICDEGPAFIHAHAGLRKVLRTSAPLLWRIEKVWRTGPSS